MAIRTRWFDDQIEAALGMPVSSAWLPHFLLDTQLVLLTGARTANSAASHLQQGALRSTGRPPLASMHPAATFPAAAHIPACLRAAGAPTTVDLGAYVWAHPQGHEPRQVGAAAKATVLPPRLASALARGRSLWRTPATHWHNAACFACRCGHQVPQAGAPQASPHATPPPLPPPTHPTPCRCLSMMLSNVLPRRGALQAFNAPQPFVLLPLQLVMLGAGMDSRPWRMKLPAGKCSAVGCWAHEGCTPPQGRWRLELKTLSAIDGDGRMTRPSVVS